MFLLSTGTERRTLGATRVLWSVCVTAVNMNAIPRATVGVVIMIFTGFNAALNILFHIIHFS